MGSSHRVDEFATPAEHAEEQPAATSLSAFFHMVNRVIPEEQVLFTLKPHTPAGEALREMKARGYSQVPVVRGRQVLGVFSYRAFALEAAKGSMGNPGDLPVSEFVHHEKPQFARTSDEFERLVESLDEHDVVLVSARDNLTALLTPMDVLRYLHRAANAFVLLEEIELSLRTLILLAVPSSELAACVQASLTGQARRNRVPERVEDMVFNDYLQIVKHDSNWPRFADVFGGTRERFNNRFDTVRQIRNVVFHFKRELTAEDHQTLADAREWLLLRLRNEQGRREEGP